MLFHFADQLVKVEPLQISFTKKPREEIKPCITIHYTENECGCGGSTRVTMGMMHWEVFLVISNALFVTAPAANSKNCIGTEIFKLPILIAFAVEMSYLNIGTKLIAPFV